MSLFFQKDANDKKCGKIVLKKIVVSKGKTF